MRRSIEDLLHGNGNLIGANNRAGRSLSAPDRRIILRARQRALDAGYLQQTINALEMEGELGIRGHMAFPLVAAFRGLQDVDLFGMTIRLYNIEGDHPLNNSTVGVGTLLRNKIMPLDISLPRMAWECTKEQFIIGVWYLRATWQVLKIKVGVRS